jgi:hypothetical protein
VLLLFREHLPEHIRTKAVTSHFATVIGMENGRAPRAAEPRTWSELACLCKFFTLQLVRQDSTYLCKDALAERLTHYSEVYAAFFIIIFCLSLESGRKLESIGSQMSSSFAPLHIAMQGQYPHPPTSADITTPPGQSSMNHQRLNIAMRDPLGGKCGQSMPRT